MYIPAHFSERRLPVLHEFIRANSFGVIVCQVDGVPFATHLPFVIDSADGSQGTLKVHMARANPHWRAFQNDTQVLVIFSGPHNYISPNWYENEPAIPTWNYTAVHAYGVPRILENENLSEAVAQLIDANESHRDPPWSIDKAPPEAIRNLAKNIVAFDIPIDRLEGKFKLSQNRTAADREKVIANLHETGETLAVDLAKIMIV